MKKHIVLFLSLMLLPLFSCNKEEPGGGGKIDPPMDPTVFGTVKGQDGTPIADVVVSDGIRCVKTDAQGKYALPVDLSGDLSETLQYVFVSTPKNWSAPLKTKEGPVFWEWLKDHQKNDGKITGVDFTLKPISDPDNFTLFIFGDPQPRTSGTGKDDYTNNSAFRAVDICNDMYKDMEEYAKTKTSPVYAIGLGDIVHRKVSYLPTYRQKMEEAGLVCYNVIGNHDQVNESGQAVKGMTDKEACKAFEKRMGPTNYSFNLGNMHFLMIDNMMAQDGKVSDECLTGLTEEIWTFVQNDLALVPSSATIMLCAHSPMMHQMGQSGYRTGPHLDDLRRLLGRFEKVYAWAGHTHSTFNFADRNINIETHTLGRVTGALWTNEYLSENGTPRGYMVVDCQDGNIKSWQFKPIFWQQSDHLYKGGVKEPGYTYRDWTYDSNGRAMLKPELGGGNLTDDYQMQVFKPGVYENGYIYVNVFLWDELWKKPILTIGDNSSVGIRVTGYSYADREMKDFYARIWEGLAGQWFDPKNEPFKYTGPYPESQMTNCASMFKFIVNDTQDLRKGTVTVTDRFGKIWSQSISW